MSRTVHAGNNTGLDDGVKIASDLIGTGSAPGAGDDVQYVKLDLGATGASSPVSGSVPVSGPLTDAQLRATSVPVDTGHTQPLTDTQLRASAVPVSGPLTDTQLRATPVPVSGPLTDTQLRASAVPVSGPLTDTQLRASAVPVSAATLTDGTQKAIVRGGAKGATAAADVTSTAEGADHQALDVQIMHGGTAKDPTQIRALVSGTDAVTVGAALPTGDNVIGRAKVTDGTNVQAVKAASTAPAAADPAAVVAISPNSPVAQVSTSVSSVLQTTANTAQANQINLAAPGAGLFHYIDQIIITRVNNTVTATAADTTARAITSANLGGWAHELGSALAAGGAETFMQCFPNGLRAAVANTATQISTPAGGTGTKIRITVVYRIGP